MLPRPAELCDHRARPAWPHTQAQAHPASLPPTLTPRTPCQPLGAPTPPSCLPERLPRLPASLGAHLASRGAHPASRDTLPASWGTHPASLSPGVPGQPSCVMDMGTRRGLVSKRLPHGHAEALTCPVPLVLQG